MWQKVSILGNMEHMAPSRRGAASPVGKRRATSVRQPQFPTKYLSLIKHLQYLARSRAANQSIICEIQRASVAWQVNATMARNAVQRIRLGSSMIPKHHRKLQSRDHSYLILSGRSGMQTLIDCQ